MFNYVSDFSTLAHHIIKEFVKNKGIAIDGTLGNGHDTDFLSKHFNTVYAFEIQQVACSNYALKSIENVRIINDSHHKFNSYINDKVDCIIYNLGFLPGGDKSITTKEVTSLESITTGLELLNSGGLMLVSVYRGHTEGKNEDSSIRQLLANLPKKYYGVMEHNVINRSDLSPILYVIEKK